MGRPSKKFLATEIVKGQLVRVYNAFGAFTDRVLDVEVKPDVVVISVEENGKSVQVGALPTEKVRVVSTHVQDTGCTMLKSDFPEDGSVKACPLGGEFWEHYRTALPDDGLAALPLSNN